FGWIVTGDETAIRTAKQFDSRENATAANRPVLTVDFTAPSADLAIAKSHVGNFRQGDAADNYTITVSNPRAGPTSAAVTVTDTLPTGLTPTVASGTGWVTTINGQLVTATRNDVLASGGSYPVLTVTVSVSLTAPASVVNTAQVAGGGETNTANDTANDNTTIVPFSATVDYGNAPSPYPTLLAQSGPGHNLSALHLG